jgi:hypothetical protein
MRFYGWELILQALNKTLEVDELDEELGFPESHFGNAVEVWKLRRAVCQRLAISSSQVSERKVRSNERSERSAFGCS